MLEQEGTLAKPDIRHDTAQCEHISRMLAQISDKWTLLVVRVLGHGPRRFNALRREVGEISPEGAGIDAAGAGGKRLRLSHGHARLIRPKWNML